MKFYILFALVALAVASAAPNTNEKVTLEGVPVLDASATVEERNLLLNILINRLIAYLRNIINNGSIIFGIPPLDPLELDDFHLDLPAGLINLDITIQKGLATGFGSFVATKSTLNLNHMTFDVEVSIPVIDISAGRYALTGDLFNAIPLYGDGEAKFLVENFRMGGLFHLKQSEDGKSILIESIESPWFSLPSLNASLSGVIGGGDIDAIVNAIINEVVVDYANRFHGAIGRIGAAVITRALNPMLEQLDTWRFIAPFV